MSKKPRKLKPYELDIDVIDLDSFLCHYAEKYMPEYSYVDDDEEDDFEFDFEFTFTPGNDHTAVTYSFSNHDVFFSEVEDPDDWSV